MTNTGPRSTATRSPSGPPSTGAASPRAVIVRNRPLTGSGAVPLYWKTVNASDVRGYLVYYGDRPGDYHGVDSDRGHSPIDVGRTTDLRLTGLANGKLYYFSVVAYDSTEPPHRSLFAREVSARPSAVAPAFPAGPAGTSTETPPGPSAETAAGLTLGPGAEHPRRSTAPGLMVSSETHSPAHQWFPDRPGRVEAKSQSRSPE